LIVHGPLIATLLLDLLGQKLSGALVQCFAFGAVTTLFDIAAFEVCGKQEDDKTIRLWA
jgi:3-methylfumaryl-CoA hydratase